MSDTHWTQDPHLRQVVNKFAEIRELYSQGMTLEQIYSLYRASLREEQETKNDEVTSELAESESR